MCCYIRAQKRQRMNAREVKQRSGRDFVAADSDLEAHDSKNMHGQATLQAPVQNAVVGMSGMPVSYLADQNQYQKTPSNVGLMVQAPEMNAGVIHTQMLGPQTPMGTYNTAQPEQVQLQFVQNEQEVYSSTQGTGALRGNPF